MNRCWPTRPGRGEGYHSQSEGQACGNELGLASKDSTFHWGVDLYFNLFRRPQGGTCLPFLSPQTPQELTAWALCSGLGAYDSMLTFLSHASSKALETSSCHLPLESGDIPVG